MNTVFWTDTETTGDDDQLCGLVEVAGLFEIDGNIDEEFSFTMAPFESDYIDPKALQVLNTTEKELRSRPDQDLIFPKVKRILRQYLFGESRLCFAGHNAYFDYGFLKEWFRVNGDRETFFRMDFHLRDTASFALGLIDAGMLTLPDVRLCTLAEYFGITYTPHRALDDIKATREVYQRLMAISRGEA